MTAPAAAAEGILSAGDRKEWMKLRSLLADPGSVQLLHSDKAHRVWLTDNTVLLDVTGNPVVDPDLEDGLYRLVTTRGLVRKPGIPTWNLPIFFGQTKYLAWLPVRPTPFSITDNEAKAMLVYADATPPEGGMRTRVPLAVNGDIWHAFFRAYPEASVWHAGHVGPFRVTTPRNDELAYIEQIQIPFELHRCVIPMLEAMDAGRKDDPGPGDKDGDSDARDEAAGAGNPYYPLE